MNRATTAIGRWFQAALVTVDPGVAVEQALECEGRRLSVAGRSFDVRGSIVVVAVGKAALPMALAAAGVCRDVVATGLLITKEGHLVGRPPEGWRAYEASHPIPDERGVAATQRALDLLAELDEDDLVLALISGGGSALLEAPVPPVTLAQMRRTTDLLLKAGAPIQDLNAVRTPLSLVKGGGLRRAAPRTPFVTLALSDVLGNDPKVIASGPTIPVQPNPERAFELIRRYGLDDSVPEPVLSVLRFRQGERSLPVTAEDDAIIIVGDNDVALRGMRTAIQGGGLTADLVWREQGGEARDLGRAWVNVCRDASPKTDVVLGGGEATVTVRGSGTGGRNTEFALAAALELERTAESGWAIASLATDGQDGPTGVAGAVVDGQTLERARRTGLNPELALADNDSLSVFQAAGGLVAPGPTGTNVNDLYVGVRLAALDRIRWVVRG
jgi:glycerate-2-kinase